MIVLEPFERNDFGRLIQWIDNEEILVQFGGPLFSFPLTIDQLEVYKNEKQRFSYKVILSSGREIIGHAELSPSDEKTMIKICRVLIGDMANRGRGFGQQIISQLLDISFLKLNKERAELNVYDWNTAAIRCYQNAGFVINPHKISTSTVKGNVWTAVNMTLDKDRWLGIRGKPHLGHFKKN